VSGTSGQTLRHNGTTWVANSILYNDGTNVGIGNTSPMAKLAVGGAVNAAGNINSSWGDFTYYVQYPTAHDPAPSYAMGFSTNAAVRRLYIDNKNGDGSSSDPNGGITFRTGNAPSDRMHVSFAGNVGIGTTSPSNKLDVIGTLRATSVGNSAQAIFGESANTTHSYIQINSAAAYQSAISFQSAGSQQSVIYRPGSSNDLHFWTTTAGDVIRMTQGGNVAIGAISPSYKLHVNGQMKSDGFLESSDRRLKKNILPLTDALDKVMHLEGVSYTWKTIAELEHENIAFIMSRGDKADIGLIAQEVEMVLPQLVSTDNAGFKSVEYSKIVALLIEAIKEQKTEIDLLKVENIGLRASASRTDRMEAELQEIRSLLLQQSSK